MEYPILATQLNDFIFCPISIYFHNMYGNRKSSTYKSTYQTSGTHVHKTLDEQKYSTKISVISGLDGYSEHYNLTCVIDMFDVETGILTERKKKIKQVFDGYVFQLYAQYFCLLEEDYVVRGLRLYSMDDNKVYSVALPEQDDELFTKFKELLEEIKTFDFEGFVQTNPLKCKSCIYQPVCDRSLEELEC